MGFNLKGLKETANKSTFAPFEFFEVNFFLCFLDAGLRDCEKANFMNGIPASYSCGFVSIRGYTFSGFTRLNL